MLVALTAGIGAATVLWFSCRHLERASHRLGTYYGLPDVVQGSVIMAVASSFPELATAVLAIPGHGDFELGLAAIIGSAIYNVLVIPALSVLAIGKSLGANRAIVYREAQFYLVSVVVLLLVICLSVIYGGNGGPASQPGELIRGSFSWRLALIPLALYGLYLFIQWEEAKDHRALQTEQEIAEAHRNGTPVRDWSVLLLTMGLILIGVEVLIRVSITLGEALGTPTFLWGLTVVAAATSIPDTFVSVRAAQLGRSDSALSNALGSNVFDLLVAVPVAVVVAGTVAVNFTQIVPMMGFLVVATIVTLVFLRRDMRLSRWEAGTMLALYLGFGAWMALEAFGITHVLGLSAS